MRKGVKFHNGDEMTADDVVFTFGPERMFGPGYSSSSSKTLFTTVMTRDSVEGKTLPPEVVATAKRVWPSLDKVEAVDRYTVRFTLHEPRPRFITSSLTGASLAGAQAREVVEFYGDNIGEHPVGTGPFRLKQWVRKST